MTRISRGSQRVDVIRNWVNFWCGWALVAGFSLMLFYSDPLALAWPKEGWTGMDQDAVLFVLESGLASLGSYALLAKPRVVVQGDNIEIVNPVFRWQFSRADIDAPAQTRDAIYESLLVNGKKIRAVGTERSVLASMRGKDHYLSAVATSSPERSEMAGPPHGPTRRWSLPAPVEVVLILVFLGYLGLGWLKGAGTI